MYTTIYSFFSTVWLYLFNYWNKEQKVFQSEKYAWYKGYHMFLYFEEN